MLLTSAALCRAGKVGFDGVLIPTVALFSSFGPAIALAALGSTLQNTFAAGNRVLDILDETPAVAEVTGEAEIGFDGAAAENVTFSYGGETILDNVSVDIPAHAVVGIVGRSGSGKSTLLKLLMRFWDVREGHVRISGTDIARVNTANLRALEGFVTQETHLFQGTIRDNLRIARPDATDEEIAAACRKASVHAFIAALPQGYDTQVGELGDTLSGGERQRLGLARAFLHDAPFLLLDDLDELLLAYLAHRALIGCLGTLVDITTDGTTPFLCHNLSVLLSVNVFFTEAKLLQKSEMRKDIVIELSYKGFG